MVCPIPRSGKLGFVGDYTGDVLTRFPRVRNWSLEELVTPQLRVYSGTRFGTQRVPGFITHTGRFEGFGGIPPLFVGDTFDFIGYTAPTNGVPCTPGCAYVIPAIVSTLSIDWNWTADARGVNWSIGFASNGVIEPLPTFDDPCDDLVYCDSNPCDLELIVKNPCAADAVVEWCNLVSATLNFTSNLIEYSNSSTLCQVKREPGNLDFTLEVIEQNPCKILTTNSDYWISIEVNATQFWSLKWAQYLGQPSKTVNIETGEIIQATSSFGMQAVNCCVPGTPVRGAIVAPDLTVVWPYATPA